MSDARLNDRSVCRVIVLFCLLAMLAPATFGAEITAPAKHYAFDLVTLNLSDKMRKGRSSSQRIQIDIPSAMTDDDLETVRTLLDQLGATQPDGEGYRHFAMANGTRVRIGGFVENPEVAGAGVPSLPAEFSVANEFSTEEAALVLRIATAANLFVSSPDDSTLVATTYEVTDRPFHKEHPRATFTPDAQSLAQWVRMNIALRDEPEQSR
jgi:hypothetical protein